MRIWQWTSRVVQNIGLSCSPARLELCRSAPVPPALVPVCASFLQCSWCRCACAHTQKPGTSLTLQRRLNGSSQELALLLMQLHSIADQQLQLLKPGRDVGRWGFDGQAVSQEPAWQGSYALFHETKGLATFAFMGRQSTSTCQGSSLQGCHQLRDRFVAQPGLQGMQWSHICGAAALRGGRL